MGGEAVWGRGGSEAAEVALSGEDVEKRLRFLRGWRAMNGSIKKNYRFRDFRGAIDFVNRVAEVAEAEDHHPDILVWSWNNVKLTLSTHRVNGLSERDFAFASKVDALGSMMSVGE